MIASATNPDDLHAGRKPWGPAGNGLTPDSTGEGEREDDGRDNAPAGWHVDGTHLDSLPRDSGLSRRHPTGIPVLETAARNIPSSNRGIRFLGD